MNAEARRVLLETGAATVIECWGDAGPAVLCVHGIASSRRDFARLGEALSATHRVFAYDQRGHGDAEAAAPLSLDVLAADLRAVADSIGTVAAVVGHSWGGAVALVGGPKIARALVLVDPMVRVPPGTFDRDYVEDLAPLLAAPPGDARDDAVRAAFANADARDRDGKVHAMRRLQLDTVRQLGIDNDADAGGWDLRERLRAPKVPVTILLAGEESVVAHDDLDGAGANVRVLRFDGHGHTLHRTGFDRFAGIVRDAVPA
ncbi:MAG TPA: alpha/beta fold hydrolase [Candidatus Elarobacter sp.]|nr:alpha/beta fold hydrolase [Candidatus Elarobacter sp.]